MLKIEGIDSYGEPRHPREKEIYRNYRTVGSLYVFIGIISGIVYTLLQLYYTGTIGDKVYSGILIANLYAMYQFIIFYIKYFSAEFESVERSIKDRDIKGNIECYMTEVFGGVGPIISGVAYGIATVFLFYGPWQDNEVLLASYTAFVFFGNALAGAAIYCLIRYFRRITTIGVYSEISLWDRSCPIYKFVINSSKYIVYGVGYISITAIISVMFSLIGTGAPAYIWSIWSALVLVTTFTIPLMPISNKIKNIKDEKIEKIDKGLQRYHEEMEIKIDNSADISFDNIDAIKQLRSQVKSVRVFPPIGAKSLETAAIISLLTVLPSLLEFIVGSL